MATHSSILAWRIPGTGEPVGLPSMGLHRVGHDWSDLAAAAVSPDSMSPAPLWVSSPGLLRYNWHVTFVSLRHTMCWFDIFISCKMTVSTVLPTTSSSFHIYHFFFFWWWEYLRTPLLATFRYMNKISLDMIAMLYIRFPKLVNLIMEVCALCLYLPISPIPQFFLALNVLIEAFVNNHSHFAEFNQSSIKTGKASLNFLFQMALPCLSFP